MLDGSGWLPPTSQARAHQPREGARAAEAVERSGDVDGELVGLARVQGDASRRAARCSAARIDRHDRARPGVWKGQRAAQNPTLFVLCPGGSTPFHSTPLTVTVLPVWVYVPFQRLVMMP